MRVGWILLAFLSGCDDTIFGGHSGGGTDPVTGDGFEAVEIVFANSCLTGCHEASVAVGSLDLETDPCNDLVGIASSLYADPLVVAGDSEASVLWHKMANTGTYGGVMPPTGSLDNPDEDGDDFDVVAAWIDSGAACSDGDTGVDDTGGGGNADYSFARVQSEVLDEHCIGCHNPDYTPPSDSALKEVPSFESSVSYDNLVNVTSAYGDAMLVDPGNPEGSFLLEKLRSDPTFGRQMPRNKDALDPEFVTLVYGWILEGAEQ